VLGVVRENPGISKTQAFAAAGGNRSEFHAAIDALVREGRLVEGASRDPS
jgi:hypothetical protein